MPDTDTQSQNGEDGPIAATAITQPGVQGGPRFVMSKTEWLAIQVYVNNALALPTTTGDFARHLGPGAPKDLSEFNDLVSVYADINAHCKKWQDETFPMTVSLAGDIYDYGINTVPTYYGGLVDPINVLIDKKSTPEAKSDANTTIAAILQAIKDLADGYKVNADKAMEAVKDFANQTADDNRKLSGADGNGGIKKQYNDKYGARSEEVTNLQKQLDATRLALAGDQAEYDHDVVVAATSPTYAWVVPLGTIAAAIVAGIYGHKAVEAMDRIKADNDRIASLNNQISADAALISALDMANISIAGISKALEAALPIIEKVQGFWGAMAKDIDSIITTINKNIEGVPPIIEKLGVSKAIKQWDAVGRAADQYRLNAYVTTKPATVEDLDAFRKAKEAKNKAA